MNLPNSARQNGKAQKLGLSTGVVRRDHLAIKNDVISGRCRFVSRNGNTMSRFEDLGRQVVSELKVVRYQRAWKP